MGEGGRKVIRRQVRVAHGHLDIAVTQDTLQREDVFSRWVIDAATSASNVTGMASPLKQKPICQHAANPHAAGQPIDRRHPAWRANSQASGQALPTSAVPFLA